VIGIALRYYDAAIVAEFFQLFKTPWEYVRPGGIYEVIMTDADPAEIPEARLVIVFSGNQAVPDRPAGIGKPVLVRSEAVEFPIYSGVRRVLGGLELLTVKNTGECVGCRRDEGGRTVVQLGYDIFAEVDYMLRFGQPQEYAGFPTLDLHITLLREWILAAGIPLVEIPPVSKDTPFFACLTHDVDFGGIKYHKFDRTAAGFIYRALVKSAVHYLKGQYSPAMVIRNWRAVAELPLIHLGLRRDFWSTFRDYRDIEGEAPSTFFFVPFKDRPGRSDRGTAPPVRAVKYDVADLREDIRALLAEGCEIGVHGIDAWVDADQGKNEIARIWQLTGQPPAGVRMHWLYFDPESPARLEHAGFGFDSTCGYNERIGYRAGTGQVFRPPGVEHLLELPMQIMDSAMFYPERMNLTLAEGQAGMASLMDTAARFGGVLTFNWHDRSVAPERLWDGVYHWALDELRRRGARFMTAAATVEWFRKRRAVTFDGVHVDGSSIRVKWVGLSATCADGMVLRIHRPARPPRGDQPFRCEYRDFPLDGRDEVVWPI
jgi:hypothetical protein